MFKTDQILNRTGSWERGFYFWKYLPNLKISVYIMKINKGVFTAMIKLTLQSSHVERVWGELIQAAKQHYIRP